MKFIMSGSCRIAILAAAFVACTPANAENDLFTKLQKLAVQQDAEALYHLGMMHLLGVEAARDQQLALDYFRKSAELGDALAAYKLGCFYDGQYQLLEVDLDAALHYKLVAAKAGYALAQQDVAGLLYQKGDTESSLMWLKRAADQGTRDALRAYASVHNGAEGIDEDRVKVAAYFTISLTRYGGSEQQEFWLTKFEEDLSPDEKGRVAEIIANYQAKPTLLTIQALSGMRAAEVLVSRSE